jgi:hypothetical protein
MEHDFKGDTRRILSQYPLRFLHSFWSAQHHNQSYILYVTVVVFELPPNLINVAYQAETGQAAVQFTLILDAHPHVIVSI